MGEGIIGPSIIRFSFNVWPYYKGVQSACIVFLHILTLELTLTHFTHQNEYFMSHGITKHSQLLVYSCVWALVIFTCSSDFCYFHGALTCLIWSQMNCVQCIRIWFSRREKYQIVIRYFLPHPNARWSRPNETAQISNSGTWNFLSRVCFFSSLLSVSVSLGRTWGISKNLLALTLMLDCTKFFSDWPIHCESKVCTLSIQRVSFVSKLHLGFEVGNQNILIGCDIWWVPLL